MLVPAQTEVSRFLLIASSEDAPVGVSRIERAVVRTDGNEPMAWGDDVGLRQA
jgi:hypothetical protein